MEQVSTVSNSHSSAEQLQIKLEAKVAAYEQTKYCLSFNSGFAGIFAVFQLVEHGTTILLP